MKQKYLVLPIAALAIAGGLWLARSSGRLDHSEVQKSSMEAKSKTSSKGSQPGEMHNQRGHLAPPNPTRRFIDFTPEQRVEFARKGHGPGG
jgi:hypothetical protein